VTAAGLVICAPTRAELASKNSAYLHGLLRERQPGFLAALGAAERQIDLELSGEAARMAAVPELDEP
jgi:hypothetical protein